MKGDTHIHTNISDGSNTIDEVLEIARKKGLDFIAITNHDTVEGLEEAMDLGEQFNVKVVPGIEISAYDYETNKKVHILGYNFNLHAKNIKALCANTLEKRHENSLWQINRLIAHGYEITTEEVLNIASKSKVIYKQHIMEALINKGYATEIYGQEYYKIFKNNGICCRDISYVNAVDAVKAIKRDGGQAILAHPGQQQNYDSIQKLIVAGLDGLELNHLSHSEEDKERIKEFSLEFGFLLTGGSDYHGSYGSLDVNIGDYQCPSHFFRFLDSI